MAFENILFASICWFSSLAVGLIALWAFKRKDPMHFWSGSTVRPEEITDIPAYNRANGWMWTIYTICIVVAGIVALFDIGMGVIILIVIAVPGLAVLVIVYKRIYNKYRNTSPAYKNGYLAPMRSKTSKMAIIASIVITVLVAIVIGIMYFYGSKEPVVSIRDNSIEIKSMYGVTVDFSEITDVSLIEKSMSDIGIGVRTNGYDGGIGESLKGNFKADNLGDTLLFVKSKTSPTIRIERGERRDIYINFHDSEATRALYAEIKEAL